AVHSCRYARNADRPGIGRCAAVRAGARQSGARMSHRQFPARPARVAVRAREGARAAASSGRLASAETGVVMRNMMGAAIATSCGRPLILSDIAIPTPGPGEVLVRVAACGVCHTDIHAVDGDWPVKPK